MIPDHLIDKTAAAIYAAGDQFAYDAWHDMPDDSHVKTTTRMFARAALEAVAADIWEDGYEAGGGDEHAINGADKRGDDWPPLTPNPYLDTEDE